MDEKIAPQAIVTPESQEKGIRDNADQVWQAFSSFACFAAADWRSQLALHLPRRK